MKLPEYVKPYPRFLNPFNARGAQPAFLKTIWLRQDIYEDLKKSIPSPVSVSLLIHEEEHLKNSGWVKAFKYLIPKLRISEEFNAYKVQFSYLKKHQTEWDIDHTARALSGPVYFWAMSYQEAKKLLEKTWREA